MILQALRTTFKKEKLATFHWVKQQILNLKDQWKSQSTKQFIDHIKCILAKDNMATSSSNPRALAYLSPKSGISSFPQPSQYSTQKITR